MPESPHFHDVCQKKNVFVLSTRHSFLPINCKPLITVTEIIGSELRLHFFLLHLNDCVDISSNKPIPWIVKINLYSYCKAKKLSSEISDYVFALHVNFRANIEFMTLNSVFSADDI
ncbi:hypothetical protein MS3_00008514 [Schistosoma haematobium]|uniref:Uncharacterized protein n=1 Tax=Schistosoma haematobium TaxID=6185 RepID=A0A094ZFY5_SCHHA|nr:hypothetical protein MS3_00008514 [Schistosoma haematobium]KAH9581337.1 hypothetical protein MS3_00008514 [Schistosoma haematobium]